MNLKKIVCSLELSKSLFEAGFECESVFVWEKFNDIEKAHVIPKSLMNIDLIDEHEFIIDTYTATELLEWLPKELRPKVFLDLHFCAVDKQWKACYENQAEYNRIGIPLLHSELADTPQEALAKLVLWVLKEGK